MVKMVDSSSNDVNLTTEEQKKEVCEIKNLSRPLSYYDNNILESGSLNSSNNNISGDYTFTRNPTQTHCLTTTVPQNIAAQNIAGKHTPTRNSLRHSRMIVLNRNGKVLTADLPPIIRYRRLAKSLLIGFVILGIFLCFLSIWLLIWSPNIRSRDNPYWSAIPTLISGIVGLIFFCCRPKDYPGKKLNCLVHFVKLTSITTSIIAAAASFTICTFAIVHLLDLATMLCSPPDKLNATCVCKSNSTEESLISSYHYVDLSCPEVNTVLSPLTVFGCIINIIIGISEVTYLYLHWTSIKVSVLYSRVPTNANTVHKNAR